VLMLLPRFRRPRLRPDWVSDGCSIGGFHPGGESSATGHRLAAAPFGVFSFKEQQRTLQRPASQFTDICIQEEIR
jgi:hypothetical protein